ncbi:MAG: hypothetical protein NT166_03365 [Candidatus Aminicenantes bacterium]|nr:hypothetical protein [Candidatus Aminicenantes bacterium]
MRHKVCLLFLLVYGIFSMLSFSYGAIKELERIEMHFGQNFSAVRGYMITGNQLRRLPIGSTPDKKTGAFYWSPGPGFYGTYDLVFLIKDAGGQWYKEMVEITIEPM